MRRLLVVLVGLSLVLVLGCQRISYQKTLTLPRDQTFLEVEFKAPKREQTVTAVAASEGIPLRVFLVLNDYKDEAVTALEQGKNPRRTLGQGEGTGAKAEGKVPAGKGFVVLVRAVAPPGKDIEVGLDIEGK